MQMKRQNRSSSGTDIPYGTRYPHLTYGFQSEVLLRPPQYQPHTSDHFYRPLAQVLYKPTPTYHSPRLFLPVLHQRATPPLHFPVYHHDPQVCINLSPFLLFCNFCLYFVFAQLGGSYTSRGLTGRFYIF